MKWCSIIVMVGCGSSGLTAVISKTYAFGTIAIHRRPDHNNYCSPLRNSKGVTIDGL